MALEQTASGRWTGEYVNFDVLTTPSALRTQRWVVANKHDYLLGEVKWFPPWRKYAFCPEPKCLFEETCLRDIAQFIVDRTKEHKSKK